jgi:hypothetical protein
MIFTQNAVLWALNHADARERLQRALAFADLVESFAVYDDRDHWVIVSRENLVPLIAALQRYERGEDGDE